VTQQQWNQNSEDDVQMPLGTGDGGGGPEFGGEEKKPKVNGSTFVLVGAFASALAVIYLMGLQNRPQTASAEQMAHDVRERSAITELLEKKGKADDLKGLFTDTRKLVKMFYSYLGTQRSDVPQLSHDPFGPTEPAAAPAPVREAVQIVSENPADAEKLRQVAEQFKGLKLHSVMLGRTPVAMINRNMVQVGNRLGDLTVVSIEADRVLLGYEKNVFELKLSQPGDTK
jgi:hypothetical protein